MRSDKKSPSKPDKKSVSRVHKRGVVGYNKKTALLEDAITQMNAGKYGRSSAALKELLALDPLNTEARRLFATLHLRLGSLISARTAFESLAREALERQDYWLAESLLREYLTAGPRCVPFLEMLGQVYEQKGDAMAAISEYGKAIEVLTEDPDFDRPTRAAELFAKIRALAPGSPVSFRLAELFDATSGEMLPSGPSMTEQVPADLGDSKQPAPDAGKESVAVTPMPWEQPDETFVAETSAPSENVQAESSPDVTQSGDRNAETPQDLDNAKQDTGTLVQEFSPAAHDLEAAQPVQDSITKPSFKLIRNEDPSTTCPTVEELNLPDASVASEIHQVPSELNLSEDQPGSTVQEPAVNQEPVLQEVTEPIAEGPSTPSPMPWDQIQEVTLNIPQSVIEPPHEDAVTEADLPEVAAADPQRIRLETDQTVVTVPPESLLSTMSWEEVLASIGDSSQSTSGFDPERAEATDTIATTSQGSPQDPSDGSLTPAMEALMDSPILSTPMPWEQIEEDTVPILQHEPEPEFGAVTDTLTSTIQEKAVSDSPEETIARGVQALAANPTEAISEPTAQNTLLDDAKLIVHQDTEELCSEMSEPLDAMESHASVLESTAIEQDKVARPHPEAHPVGAEESTLIVRVDVRTKQEGQAQGSPVEVQEQEVPVPSPAEDVDESCRAGIETRDTVVTMQGPSSMTSETEAPAELKRPETITEPSAGVPAEGDGVGILREEEQVYSSVVPATSSVEMTTSESDAIPAHSESVRQNSADQELKIIREDQSQPSSTEPVQANVFTRWLHRIPQTTEPDPEHREVTACPEPSVGIGEAIDQAAASRRTVAASAVEVLFDRSGQSASIRSRDQRTLRKSHRPHTPLAIRLFNRTRMGLTLFIGTCFSTTRSITVSLLSLAAALLALGIISAGGIGLLWVVMEERPNTAFHNLSAVPQRTLQDASKNGYFMLLGFDGRDNHDPIQVGFERKFEEADLERARVCLMGVDDRNAVLEGASAGVLSNWVKTSSDPAAQFRSQSASIKSWAQQTNVSMLRYKQWLKMPFEDWGYGDPLSPNCPLILHTHRLYVADGFAQDIEAGVDRLETDLGMWRTILGQAKTLRMKMLAANAMTDDVSILSGLLVRPDLDERVVARLSKAARPLTQVEQSVRWPMQSQFMTATKMFEQSLKQQVSESQPIYVSMASLMPLPKQQRFNRYADYYEASNRAASEGRYGNVPKLSAYVRTPVDSWIDYVMNPIENIVGLEPLPAWETYGMRVIQLDARLRLAGLQAWVRRGPQENDLLTRIAKAGQSLYDPFSGLPMLVNAKKVFLYSVGPDGKDDDANPILDVVAGIPPIAIGSVHDGKRSSR